MELTDADLERLGAIIEERWLTRDEAGALLAAAKERNLLRASFAEEACDMIWGPDNWVRFRQLLRNALFPFWPNNPGVGNDEIVDAVRRLMAARDEAVQERERLRTENARLRDEYAHYRYEVKEETLADRAEMARLREERGVDVVGELRAEIERLRLLLNDTICTHHTDAERGEKWQRTCSICFDKTAKEVERLRAAIDFKEHERQTFERQLNDKLLQLRERDGDVARLTRERDEAHAALEDSTMYCSGEFPCEASTAAASLERQLHDAQDLVRDLAGALSELLRTEPMDDDEPELCAARLAARAVLARALLADPRVGEVADATR